MGRREGGKNENKQYIYIQFLEVNCTVWWQLKKLVHNTMTEPFKECFVILPKQEVLDGCCYI